jgi:hypothetical protein
MDRPRRKRSAKRQKTSEAGVRTDSAAGSEVVVKLKLRPSGRSYEDNFFRKKREKLVL